ncbi:7335_t:CDS:2 [Entrophospora sp. SA101]|nr:7335_t:CDS:2 [Entrophospora sp. SA101]
MTNQNNILTEEEIRELIVKADKETKKESKEEVQMEHEEAEKALKTASI